MGVVISNGDLPSSNVVAGVPRIEDDTLFLFLFEVAFFKKRFVHGPCILL